jgi:hypothetical protein
MSKKFTFKDFIDIFNPVRWYQKIFGIKSQTTITPSSIHTTWTTSSSKTTMIPTTQMMTRIINEIAIDSMNNTTLDNSIGQHLNIEKNMILSSLTSNVRQNNSRITFILLLISLFITSFVIVMVSLISRQSRRYRCHYKFSCIHNLCVKCKFIMITSY